MTLFFPLKTLSQERANAGMVPPGTLQRHQPDSVLLKKRPEMTDRPQDLH